MIIQLNNYRKSVAGSDSELLSTRRLFGNTAPKLRLRDIESAAKRAASPRLPELFEGLNLRHAVINSYELATQI